MSQSVNSKAPDRVRFPFVTPLEKEEMRAAIRRDQAMDPFDDRAPLTLGVERSLGFLGVPKRNILPATARQSRSLRSRRSATRISEESGQIAQSSTVVGDERIRSDAVVKACEETRSVQEQGAAEDEEASRIAVWLMDEVGKLESQIASHIASNNKLSNHTDEQTNLRDDLHVREAQDGVQSSDGLSPWLSGPIDLDEVRDRKLAQRGSEHIKSPDPTDRDEVPSQFIPKSRKNDSDSSRSRLSGVGSDGLASSGLAEDDMPVFLRAQPPEPGSCYHAQTGRRDQSYEMRMPVRHGGHPVVTLPHVHQAGAQSTLGAMILAYVVFILIPLAEWISQTMDPRIGAVVPGVTFLGWMFLHLIRRDQMFQLRVLTTWQIAHVIVGLYAIKIGVAAPIYWTSATMAVASALIVVAISAAIETYEYRVARTSTRTPLVPARRLSSRAG